VGDRRSKASVAISEQGRERGAGIVINDYVEIAVVIEVPDR
jgi:hypothetical protein